MYLSKKFEIFFFFCQQRTFEKFFFCEFNKISLFFYHILITIINKLESQKIYVRRSLKSALHDSTALFAIYTTRREYKVEKVLTIRLHLNVRLRPGCR